MTPLGELDGLSDGGVGRHAAHAEQLIRPEAQQVGDIDVDLGDATTHALGKNGIETVARAQHAPEQLLHPAAVARIERYHVPLEGRVEHRAVAQVGQHHRRRSPRLGDAQHVERLLLHNGHHRLFTQVLTQ